MIIVQSKRQRGAKVPSFAAKQMGMVCTRMHMLKEPEGRIRSSLWAVFNVSYIEPPTSFNAVCPKT